MAEDERVVDSLQNSLYGRDKEIDILNSIFQKAKKQQQVVATSSDHITNNDDTATNNNEQRGEEEMNSNVQIAFVGGSSGTGKSVLIEKVLLRNKEDCIVGIGEFSNPTIHHRRESRPFSVLRRILTEVCASILSLQDSVDVDDDEGNLLQEDTKSSTTEPSSLLLQKYQKLLLDKLRCDDICVLSHASPLFSTLVSRDAMSSTNHICSDVTESSTVKELEEEEKNGNDNKNTHNYNDYDGQEQKNTDDNNNINENDNHDQKSFEIRYSSQSLEVLKRCICDFFRIVASVEGRFLVIYIGNLQWACSLTLDFLESMLTHPELQHVVLLGCYRDDARKSKNVNEKAMEWIEAAKETTGKVNNTTTMTAATTAENATTTTPRKNGVSNGNSGTTTKSLFDRNNVTRLTLGNLTVSDIHRMLNDVMKKYDENDKDTNDLASLIQNRTSGNPFHVVQLLDHLQSEQLITKHLETLQWTWSIDKIKKQTSLSDNVLQIVSTKMKRLPNEAIDALKLAACLGFRFNKTIAELVFTNMFCRDKDSNDCYNGGITSTITTHNNDTLRNKKESILSCLYCFMKQGFLEEIDNDKQTYRFVHNEIYKAAIRLIPENIRLSIHYCIGKILWDTYFINSKRRIDNLGINIVGLDEHVLFLCVDQLNMGRKSPKMLNDGDYDDFAIKLAKLNLEAAKKSASFSAFVPAIAFVQIAIAIIKEQTERKYCPQANKPQHSNNGSHKGSYDNNDGNDDKTDDDDYCCRSLSSASWNDNHDLLYALYCVLAELSSAVGRHDLSCNAVDEVLKYCKCDLGKSRVFRTKIYVLNAQHKHEDVISETICILNTLGDKNTPKIIRNPSAIQTKYLFYETKRKLLNHMKEVKMKSKYKLSFCGKNPSEKNVISKDMHNSNKRKTNKYNNPYHSRGLTLPTMDDPRKVITIEFLCLMFHSCIENYPRLATITICRVVQLTLRHGIAPFSSVGLVRMANLIVQNSLSDIDFAVRVSELALDMADKMVVPNDNMYHVEIEKAKLRTISGAWQVMQLQKPISFAADNFLKGYEMAMKGGDADSAFYEICAYFIMYFYSGLSLTPFLDDIKKFVRQMIDYGHMHAFRINIPIFQCVLNLTGSNSNIGIDPTDFSQGDAIDLRSLVMGKESTGVGETEMSYRMQIAFYVGKIELAEKLSEKLQRVNVGFFETMPFYHARVFFFALIAMWQYKHENRRSITIASASSSNGGNRVSSNKRKYKRQAIKYKRIFENWVRNRMINCVHKLQILEAEFLSMNKAKIGTEELRNAYNKAISASARVGFLQDSGLVNFLAGVHYRYHEEVDTGGDIVTSEYFIKKARQAYQAWGANVVVDHVETSFPDIFPKKEEKDPASTNNQRGYRSRQRFDNSIQSKHNMLPDFVQNPINEQEAATSHFEEVEKI